MTTVNIVTGSMLKGLCEAGCRITTICKCKGYRLNSLQLIVQNFTIYYFTLHNYLITLWLVAKQPKLTTIFVNMMGITLGIVAMVTDTFFYI